jgi:hypothetical protein
MARWLFLAFPLEFVCEFLGFTLESGLGRLPAQLAWFRFR